MAAVNQQPSFDVIAGAMNNISRSRAILATHFDRIPALILAELRAIREDMGLRFEDVSQQLDEIKQGFVAADFNSVARLENSFLARTADSPLSPLKTAQNQPVNDFPRTLGQIDLLGSGDVNALLTAYGLPTAGLIAVRRGRLRQYIGITIRSRVSTRPVLSIEEYRNRIGRESEGLL